MGGGRTWRFDCLHFGKTSRVNLVKATKRVTLFPRTTFLLERERLIGQLFLLIFYFAS